MDFFNYFMVIISLFFVLGLAYYILKYLKKGMNHYHQTKNLRVIESIPVSQKGHLAIVKFNEKNLLLGITENNITLLKEVTADELIAETPTELPGFEFKSFYEKYIKKVD